VRWDVREFIDLMTFNHPKREMFCETMGLLVGLDEEWKTQGARADELDLTAFGFDYVHACSAGGNTGAIHTQKEVFLEETNEYVISRDSWGRTVKLMKGFATIPLPVSYPVKTMDDWRKLKPMFQFEESRIDLGVVEQAKALQKKGTMVRASIPGGFDFPRELMGEEAACLCYYDDPELMQDIINTASDTSFHVFERISELITIDCLFVHEDMAGKSGPLIGPALIKEFIHPYYRRIWDLLNSRGTKLFAQDSDGDMNPVLSVFAEAGVNIFYPCEPAAGMDIVAIRKKYGNAFAMLGGIDKHVLRKSKDEIRKELEYKLQDSVRGGGMCFGLDHRIPNGTPLENYRYYVRTAQEMLGIDGSEKGWFRFV
jgi:uroporphyrinogen-III decarboxylase